MRYRNVVLWSAGKLALLAAAIVYLASGCASGQDSTYLIGVLERAAPRSMLLAVDGTNYPLVFEFERDQADARDLAGKSVRVLGRPVWQGGQRLLLVITVRLISPPGEK